MLRTTDLMAESQARRPDLLSRVLTGPHDSRKRYVQGTARVVDPDETLARVGPWFGRFGITRVANITGLDRIGIPVVAVVRPNARSLSVSQGKGVTLSAAKASGVMEAIELYHAERVHLPLLYGSVNELSRSFALVDAEGLPSVRGSRFHPDLPLLWVESSDLCGERPIWVPFEVVSASRRVSPPAGSGCFASTSNGLALGNHIVEAVLHGLCEVIERDATSVWEASPGRKESSRLDLENVDDGVSRALVDRLQRVGIDVVVWETTSDVGVASFLCEIIDPASPLELPLPSFTGMGCHPARGIALCRAITEAVQCRVTYIAGSRDDLFRREYRTTDGRLPGGPLYGAYRDSPAARHFVDVPDFRGDSIHDDFLWVSGRLQAAGFGEQLVVDLTDSEFGIPVVRVVVPGLEGPDDDPDSLRPRAGAPRCGHERRRGVPGPDAPGRRGARLPRGRLPATSRPG